MLSYSFASDFPFAGIHSLFNRKYDQCSHFSESLPLILKKMEMATTNLEFKNALHRNVIKNLVSLKVPLVQDVNNSHFREEYFSDYLKILFGKGADDITELKEILKLLQKEELNRDELRNFIQEKSKGNIKAIFYDEIEAFAKKTPSLNGQGINFRIKKNGEISNELYFRLYALGSIPIIDHHDIISHLSLSRIESLQRATKKLSTLYVGQPPQSEMLRFYQMLIYRIWGGLQEKLIYLKNRAGVVESYDYIGGFTPVSIGMIHWASQNFEFEKVFNLDPIWSSFLGSKNFYLSAFHGEASELESAKKLKVFFEEHSFPTDKEGFIKNFENIKKSYKWLLENAGAGVKRTYEEAFMSKGVEGLKNPIEIFKDNMVNGYNSHALFESHPILQNFLSTDKQAHFWSLHIDVLLELLEKQIKVEY